MEINKTKYLYTIDLRQLLERIRQMKEKNQTSFFYFLLDVKLYETGIVLPKRLKVFCVSRKEKEKGTSAEIYASFYSFYSTQKRLFLL